jgi:hypothetical protein
MGKTMDTQTILNGAFGIASTILGWFLREMWSATKELKNDLTKLSNDLPKEYVSKADFRDDLHDIKNMIQKIFDKLDSKADRDYR